MIRVPVQQGQSLFDVVIQEYGDVSHLFKLLEDNPTLSVNSNVGSGNTVEIDTEYQATADVQAVFQARKQKNIHPVNYSDASEGDYNADYNNDYDI